MSLPVVFFTDYLDQALSLPWSWGGKGDGQDCCFFAGDWILAKTGRDPLATYRGGYDTMLGARRLIARRGGLASMVGAEMERCGFPRTSEPELGDIGVVAMTLTESEREHASSHESVMINNGADWWVGLSPEGIMTARLEPSIAWRVL